MDVRIRERELELVSSVTAAVILPMELKSLRRTRMVTGKTSFTRAMDVSNGKKELVTL